MQTETIPSSASEAQEQGWHMVCILPNRLKPAKLIDLIIPHFDQVVFDVKFTHKGRAVIAENQGALWVKGFKWSIEGRDVLLQAYFAGNPVLDRFIKGVLSPYIPASVLKTTKQTRPPRNRKTNKLVYETGQ